MNKLISLGLFALMLSTFSGQLFAGDATLCNDLKQDQNKSLYGLCVAWYHADENARGDIADKYRYRSGGSEVPGFDVNPVPAQDFFCPCWDEVSFADVCALGTPFITDIQSDPLFSVVIFADYTTAVFELFGTNSAFCGHTVQEFSGTILWEEVIDGLTVDEGLDCRAELEAIASMFSGGGCPSP